MATPDFRAPFDHDTVPAKRLRRNVEPLQIQALRFVVEPLGLVMVGLFGTMINMVFPAATLLSLVLVLMLFAAGLIYARRNRERLRKMPLRMPLDEEGKLDYGSPKPGRQGYEEAEGAYFIGNSFGDRLREVWASFKDMLTHALVLGGTGAGKTETLVSMSFNALACGGGLGYVDAKAAPKLYGQFWVMSRFVGRDDDVRVLNFALGQEKIKKTPFWRSNTMQPFAMGKAESLKEIPLSLMAGGGDGGGNNAIFASNGKALMTALMMALVEMRDKGEIYLYPGDIVHYMNPTEFVKLAKRTDFTDTTTDAIHNFLKSMGWRPDTDDSSKWGDFDRQYSYAQNYFLDTFSTMNNVYRHIFAAQIGDINLVDVILQRRIFITLIPSLEKSKKELENIGRITLSTLRLATAVGLGGGEIMGRWNQLIDMGIALARVPFFLKIDELAAIIIEGFAEIFTQGRGLGISATVGSQDWAGLQGQGEVIKKEAQQMLSNTKLKFFMTGDDPKETRQLLMDLAGETEEMRVGAYEMKGVLNYLDNKQAQVNRTSRVNMRDIAEQIEGEWHLFYKGRIIRGQGFYAGAMPDDREMPLFTHHFLQVHRPKYSELSVRYGDLKKTLEQWKKAADSGESLDEAGRSGKELPEKAIAVLAHPGIYSGGKRRELASSAIYAWLMNDPFDPAAEMDDAVGADDAEDEEDGGSGGGQELTKDPASRYGKSIAESAPRREAVRPEASASAPKKKKEAGSGEGLLPGAAGFSEAVAGISGNDSYSEPDADDYDDMVGSGAEDAIEASIKGDPDYPRQPKPEPSDLSEFQRSTSAFLSALKSQKQD